MQYAHLNEINRRLTALVTPDQTTPNFEWNDDKSWKPDEPFKNIINESSQNIRFNMYEPFKKLYRKYHLVYGSGYLYGDPRDENAKRCIREMIESILNKTVYPPTGDNQEIQNVNRMCSGNIPKLKADCILYITELETLLSSQINKAFVDITTKTNQCKQRILTQVYDELRSNLIYADQEKFKKLIPGP